MHCVAKLSRAYCLGPLFFPAPCKHSAAAPRQEARWRAPARGAARPVPQQAPAGRPQRPARRQPRRPGTGPAHTATLLPLHAAYTHLHAACLLPHSPASRAAPRRRPSCVSRSLQAGAGELHPPPAAPHVCAAALGAQDELRGAGGGGSRAGRLGFAGLLLPAAGQPCLRCARRPPAPAHACTCSAVHPACSAF